MELAGFFEDDLDRHVDMDLVGTAAHDVRPDPEPRLFHQLDQRDDVGNGEIGSPGMVVDRESEDAAPSAHGGVEELGPEAGRADRRRRVDVEVTGTAALNAKLASISCGKERTIGVGDLWKRPHARMSFDWIQASSSRGPSASAGFECTTSIGIENAVLRAVVWVD